jgi:membrane peptidoglycan carboxypeptidase
MASAYSTLANGGLRIEPFGITKIYSKDTGELYYQRTRRPRYKRVFDEYDINNLTRMMGSVMEFGTGRGANFGVPAAGKTGTSNESRDALFIGFTSELIGAVWIGNDDNSSMKNVTGGSFPALIWKDVMRKSKGQYPALARSQFRNGDDDGFANFLSNLFSSRDNNKTDNREREAREIDIRYRERNEERQRQKEKEYEEFMRRKKQYNTENPRDDDRPITQKRYNERFNN